MPSSPTSTPLSPVAEVYAVSDLHGHLDVFLAALRDARLTDQHDHWIGRNARLWVLGDYFDRGPDGPGCASIPLRRLEAETAETGW